MRLNCVCLFFLVLAPFSSLNAEKWRPVSAEEVTQKQSIIDKNANAEILFLDVRIVEEFMNGQTPHTVWTFYERRKIFTARGKDNGTVHIPYIWQNISDIKGRTIKPDGTIVELGKDAIFDQTVIWGRWLKVKVKSLTMPSLEAGAIFDYQWREIWNSVSPYLRLDLQFDIAVRQVTYHIKALPSSEFQPYYMRVMPFNCPSLPPFQSEPGGFHTFTVKNVPALPEEPFMPPENEVRQWALVYYQDKEQPSEDKFWIRLGKEAYQNYKSQIRVNGEVKRIADSATEGAKAPDDKISRLAEYWRKNLKNIDRAEVTIEQRDR